MEKVLEKQIVRYVLGTIYEDDGRCYYLRSLHDIGKYDYVFDIELATKAEKKSVIKMLLQNYQMDMGKDALDFVILPVVIEYSLVKEV